MPDATTNDPWRIVIVPETHWDREWYFPFQRFRTRLVGLIDLLLDIMESDPEYRHYMLDGQTIVLEDYLEVRPDRRDAIERFVREGRLTIGPWYVIPDEFLPSGEAMVRNLLRGLRLADEFGGAMQVGYVPDPFGHIAHLPAILSGFGIGRCVFWRGTDDSLRTTEFIWEGADGSEVLVEHLPGGYGVASPFPVEEEEFLSKIALLRGLLEPRALTHTLLVPWGTDHVPPQRELPAAIRAANDRLSDAVIVQDSLPGFFDAMEAQLDGRASLPRRRGEFRSGQMSHLLPAVMSARMWIKQRTFDCEQLLTNWAEPLSLWSGVLRDQLGDAWREPPPTQGPSSPIPHEPASEAGLLERAWRLLLENQPHDSICGCSVDETHDDMRPRFDQCEQIGEDLAHQAMRRIGAQGPAERVYVFNSLPGPRSDFVTVTVPSRRGAQPVAMVDDEGQRWSCQRVAGDGAQPGQRDRVDVGFVVGDLPGFGYRTYAVEYGRAAAASPPPSPRIENEFFSVEADPQNGALIIEDKRTGSRYEGMNRLVDGGDRGDEYNYCPPDPDVVVDGPAAPPKVRLIESGPARQTLEVRMTYRLPARLTADRKQTRRAVPCPVRVLASLSAGVPRIDVRTEFENRAEDHRLRAHFPTGIMTEVSHAEQHFGVVTRPIALPEADDAWSERPVGTQPQKTFVDVNDGERGLLIANKGLPEYEALDTPGGVTIALTLLRCTGWLSRDDFPWRRGHAGPPLATPGAQCLGSHVFEYSIVPHEGGWSQAYAEAHRFATPLRARWNPARLEDGESLAASASLLDMEGDGLVVTAIKRAEDRGGVIVRLYNTLDSPATGRLRLTEPPQHAELVDLKEDGIGPADVDGGWVRLSLRPNQIVTVRLET